MFIHPSIIFAWYEPALLVEGGPALWILTFLSILAVMVFLERLLFLHRSQIKSTEFVGGIKNILRRNRLLEALTVCEEAPGPVPAMVKAALLAHDEDAEGLRLAIQEAALAEVPVLERRIGTLAAIAQTAPVVGLLGTVLGMMEVFQVMQASTGYIPPNLLGGGFQEALLSTAAGLALAIPAYLGHHFLRGRVRALLRDMEWVGNEMLRFLRKQLPSERAEQNKASSGGEA